MAGIEADGLTKTFATYRRLGRLKREKLQVIAVKDVSFRVESGEMVGYIGPNGAGKSTTVKMLTGILYPTAGRALIAGLDPARHRQTVARRIGVVFGQRRQLWWDLPLIDSMELLRHIYRVPEGTYRTNLARLVSDLEMSPFLATPVRQLSLGQLMRGELAAALLHGPEVVFLDEPTIGLDVVSKQRVLEVLQRINREDGTTVLFTTHDVADLERLCPRMLIIDNGTLVYDGPLAKIRESYGAQRTLVVDLELAMQPLQINGVDAIRVDGKRQWLSFSRDKVSASTVISELAKVAPVVDLAIEETPIEDIVRRIYRDGLPAGVSAGGNGS
jgi:ABC-2 type transport system ATP-binding protein